jgi:hypothetical protein
MIRWRQFMRIRCFSRNQIETNNVPLGHLAVPEDAAQLEYAGSPPRRHRRQRGIPPGHWEAEHQGDRDPGHQPRQLGHSGPRNLVRSGTAQVLDRWGGGGGVLFGTWNWNDEVLFSYRYRKVCCHDSWKDDQSDLWLILLLAINNNIPYIIVCETSNVYLYYHTASV